MKDMELTNSWMNLFAKHVNGRTIKNKHFKHVKNAKSNIDGKMKFRIDYD